VYQKKLFIIVSGVARSGQVESFGSFIRNASGKLATLAGKDGIKQTINIGCKMAKISSRLNTLNNLSKGMPGFGTVVLKATSSDEGVKAVAKASTNMAGRQASEVAASIGKLDYMAMGLVLVIEGYRTYRDIHKARGQMKRGDISKAEYTRVSIKRISQGVGGTAGTIIGGAFGQVLIPIPIVGGLVGSTVGALLGEGLGALAGRRIVKQRYGK
jgi:hypothetical protein